MQVAPAGGPNSECICPLSQRGMEIVLLVSLVPSVCDVLYSLTVPPPILVSYQHLTSVVYRVFSPFSTPCPFCSLLRFPL